MNDDELENKVREDVNVLEYLLLNFGSSSSSDRQNHQNSHSVAATGKFEHLGLLSLHTLFTALELHNGVGEDEYNVKETKHGLSHASQATEET